MYVVLPLLCLAMLFAAAVLSVIGPVDAWALLVFFTLTFLMLTVIVFWWRQ
jgi:hypothetical protein